MSGFQTGPLCIYDIPPSISGILIILACAMPITFPAFLITTRFTFLFPQRTSPNSQA
ncbi:MAG: hypothetical protein ACXWE0_03855 [Nitrososphaeraceae archaeon]